MADRMTDIELADPRVDLLMPLVANYHSNRLPVSLASHATLSGRRKMARHVLELLDEHHGRVEDAREAAVVTRPDWLEDTTDVLHCSMPPQVRAHIEELRDEVARLRAAEVPLSLNVGFVGAESCNFCDGMRILDNNGEAFFIANDPAVVYGIDTTVVALIPVTAWDRT